MRGKFGRQAMVLLATPGLDGHPLVFQMREISAQEKIPANFLEQILPAQMKAGVLHGKMGGGA